MAIGPNYSAMIPNLPAGGCGMHAPTPAVPVNAGGDAAAVSFGDFIANAPRPAPERFVHSQRGGVMVDKDGNPGGRIPENSYVDLASGNVYGPDGSQITIPEGATVDFFDLPDVAKMRSSFERLQADAAGGGETAPTKVAGASGSGATDAEAPTKVAGASGSGATDAAAPTKVAGASGSGATEAAAPAKEMWGPGGVTPLTGGGSVGCDAHGTLVSNPAQTLAGGLLTAVNGVNGVGQVPGLEASLAELLKVLQELTMALQAFTIGGGSPADKPADSAPAKEPVTETPATDEKPVTETPSTESDSDVAGTSGSGSGSEATGVEGAADKKAEEPAPSVEEDTTATSSDASSSDA